MSGSRAPDDLVLEVLHAEAPEPRGDLQATARAGVGGQRATVLVGPTGRGQGRQTRLAGAVGISPT